MDEKYVYRVSFTITWNRPLSERSRSDICSVVRNAIPDIWGVKRGMSSVQMEFLPAAKEKDEASSLRDLTSLDVSRMTDEEFEKSLEQL